MKISFTDLYFNNIKGIKEELKIPLNGKSLVLLGENGTGKSSIVQAIEYGISGKLKEINEVKALRVNDHIAHILSDRFEIDIRLKFNDESEMKNGSVISSGKYQHAEFIESLIKRQDIILRRNKLVKSITDKPSDRYGVFKEFISFSSFDPIYQNISQLIINIKDKENKKETKLKLLQNQIIKTFGLKEFNENELLKILNNEINLTKKKSFKTFNQVNKYASEIGTQIPDDIKKKITNISNTQTDIGSLNSLKLSETSPIIESILVEKEKYELLFKQQTKLMEAVEDEKIIKTLNSLNNWIKANKPAKCPVCNQIIQWESVSSALDVIIKPLFGLNKNKKEIKKSTEELNHLILEFNEFFSNYLDLLIKIKDSITKEDLTEAMSVQEQEEAIKLRDLFNGYIIVLEKLDSNRIQIATALENEKLDDIEGLEQKINLILNTQPIIISNEKLVLRYSEDLSQNLVKNIQYLDHYKGPILLHEYCTKLPNIKRTSEELDNISVSLQNLEIISNYIIETHNEIIREKFDCLEEDINNIYEKMHPDEEIKNLKISPYSLNTQKIEEKDQTKHSIHFGVDYHNKANQDPRGFLSESHLDSMGLAIFLVLIKQEYEKFEYQVPIILDDLLTSLDNPHKERIARLLVTEFRDHQVIITTHDAFWFRELERIIKEEGKYQDYIFREITDWSIDHGPIIDDYETQYDTTKRLYENSRSRKQELAAQAGILLEQILKELRFNFSLAIQAKRGDKYVIGDIWNTVFKKASKTARDQIPPGFGEEGTKIVNEIERLKEIRNAVGGHYNQDALDNIPARDARIFCSNVLKLYSLVHCDYCSTFIVYRSNELVAFCKCKPDIEQRLFYKDGT